MVPLTYFQHDQRMLKRALLAPVGTCLSIAENQIQARSVKLNKVVGVTYVNMTMTKRDLSSFRHAEML